MFNRNNYPSVPTPFGSGSPARGDGSRPPRAPPQQRGGYDDGYGQDPRMGAAGGGSSHGGSPMGRPAERPMPPRQGGGRGGEGQTWSLSPAKSPDNSYTYGNLVAVSPRDIPRPRDGGDVLILVNGLYVFSARPLEGFPQGHISMSDPQRTWAQIALTDMVQNFEDQILAPGQKILMDDKSIPLLLTVKTVQLGDLTAEKTSSSAPTSSDPRSRGILTGYTLINFFKDAKTGINVKASNRRPAANSIIQPDFKFENMGIGGLDAEFSTIFRRAFASRIFPPGLVEKLGIQHVKGILLYGPPGTGKTLIARQIGKMLNAREPKVINGPEVLNKFVGQSEENIRKLFADAEKEYREKGDESGLHIIIFDELDAVCKQRGSGAGGGTGVGDSVVNQLLSKLDGVDQLNNILLIGMTNRMDMIDDALLRPGRLEVHMEISLPDEHGRAQILKIHTQKMRDNDVMDKDVDIKELAALTKNFSGAEISGLVKSASSFAFNRHVKVGTMAGISDDIVNMKVNRVDFHNALDEVKPAFGVSEEELETCIHGGIHHYSRAVGEILQEGELFVKQVRDPDSTTSLFSVLLHGPPGSGKTALAAKIAIDSGFPFVKLISPEDMVGYSEMSKVQHMNKVFMDAYKSPTSVVVIDNIERIIDWVPIGPRFSNSVLQAVMVLLRKQPPKGRRLLVLATSTERSILKQLDVFTSFNSDIPIPNINTYEELAYILQQEQTLSPEEIKSALSRIRELTQSEKIGVGVKKVLLGVGTAKQDTNRASSIKTTPSSMAHDNTDDASNKEVAAVMGFSQFSSKATQNKRPRGRRGKQYLNGKIDSLITPESSSSSISMETFMQRFAALTSAEPASSKLKSAPDAATVEETASTPDTVPGTVPASDIAGEPKRKFRKAKTWKEKREAAKIREEANKEIKSASENTGEQKDKANQRPQRRKMGEIQRAPMKQRDWGYGAMAASGAHNKDQKAADVCEGRKAVEEKAFKINAFEGNEGTGTKLPKGENLKNVTPEDRKEEPAAAPPLDKWSPIFPSGGPRPIPEPVDDKTPDGQPRRTNYIDEQGNYHAPNGTIMSPELLEMFASGQIRNSFGDRVYFMPSFLEDNPPKGQEPVVLPPTPYRIFYDPKDLEKTE
ncbi:vesicle-fusing ATPase [Arthroderma uncinatum]|uniref:vesicle-fusing ATPase n=1 Tax=Arthroderma uncinatum TaxID=74035 RepID=UPI00144ABAA5|nr:vesicle-fusing ATPase [Arthroderma uncinatum]KAF3491200.1 vesicle-fusing ATPase [Arthroderma uncinatum]